MQFLVHYGKCTYVLLVPYDPSHVVHMVLIVSLFNLYDYQPCRAHVIMLYRLLYVW